MALSKDQGRVWRAGEITKMGVASGETTYFGSIICASATGFAEVATLVAGKVVLGVCESASRDNSAGSDGDLEILVRRGEAAWLSNSAVNPVTLAYRGQNCYLEDDQKVRIFVGGGVNVPVGTILDVDSTKGVLVLIGVLSTEAGIYTSLAVSGAATIGTTLGVAGAATLASAIITGAATVGTTLGVTGVATFAAVSVHTAGLTCGAAGGGTSTLTVPYHAMTTGGAPSQANMVTAFGAAANGRIGVVYDDTPGVSYLCHADASGGWYYGTSTVGA